MFLLSGLAFAGGLHAGLPLTGAPAAPLSDPSFLAADLGWSASLPDGWARVYVAPTEADAERWYAAELGALSVPPPPATGLGDTCAGDGDALFLFRDGNVAVVVRVTSGARARAEALHAAIVDGVAWPATPSLESVGGGYRITAPWAVHVASEGGRVVPFRPGEWSERPDAVTLWDSYGRAVRVTTP